MLAQAAADSVPSLILQAGAFGLLAWIVVYMYPHQVREARAERETRDQRFEALVILIQDKFDERHRAAIDAIHKRPDSWVEQLKRHAADIVNGTGRVHGKTTT